MNHTQTQNNPTASQKQTPEQKQAQRRAANAERIAELERELANAPEHLKGTPWWNDRVRERAAAGRWRQRNHPPASPHRFQLSARALAALEDEFARHHARKTPVKPGKVAVDLLRPDGRLFIALELDEPIWNDVERLAARGGLTIGEVMTRAIESGWEEPATVKGGAL